MPYLEDGLLHLLIWPCFCMWMLIHSLQTFCLLTSEFAFALLFACFYINSLLSFYLFIAKFVNSVYWTVLLFLLTMATNSSVYEPRNRLLQQWQIQIWTMGSKMFGLYTNPKLAQNNLGICWLSQWRRLLWKNANVFAKLIQFFDDQSLSLIMREAPDNERKALQILREQLII